MTSRKAICRAVARSIESLESRQLLHGDVDITFNFQPANTPVPANTIADVGLAYADRGNGYAYGWDSDATAIMRDRNAIADQRLDTVALIQAGGDHTWELDIPNGEYAITLTSGDSRYMDGEHQIDVEGQRVMYGVQSRKKPFLVATKVIDVEDGKLTISPESMGVNSKLNSVRIISVHDDDGVEGAATPVISVNTLDGSMAETGSNTSATFQFKRTGGNLAQQLVVSLDWSGSASTADFRGRPTSVTFPANATTASIELKARADSLVEGTESAKVKILASGAYQIGSPSTGSLTIADSPPTTQLPMITITAPDVTAAEGGGDAAFRITRDNTSGSLTVNLDWTGDASSSDYLIGVNANANHVTRPASVTFTAGQSEIILYVRAVDDDNIESTETVNLNASTSSAYTVSGNAVSATIADNDAPVTKPTIVVSVPDATIAEGGGDGALRLNRDNTSGALTVNLEWSGTATSGDYLVGVHTLDHLISRPASVTFQPGEGVITMYIRAVNDSAVESDETVTVTAASSGAYNLSSASATATITDNDDDTPPPTDSFSNINWSTASSPPIVFSESTSIVIDNKMYVFGGFNGVFSPQPNVYRFDGSSWTTLNNMPLAFTHVGEAEVDSKVWFAGGYISNGRGGQIFGTTDVRIYNPATDSWSTGPSLPSGRAAGNLVKVGRKLYYFGGETQNRASDSNTMWALDLDNQSAGWQTKTSMPLSRNHASTVNVNGKIYVLGGQTGFDQGTVAHNEIQIYDPSNNNWTVASQKLPGNRSHTVSATQYYRGKIIIVAGQQGYNQQTNTVWAVDPNSLVTSVLNSFPDSRFSVATGIVNGKLYAIGGYKGQIAQQGYVGVFI